MAFPRIFLSLSFFAFTYASPLSDERTTPVISVYAPTTSLSSLPLNVTSPMVNGNHLHTNQNNRNVMDHGWCADEYLKGPCGDVQACANFLRDKNDEACVVGGPASQSVFCQS